MPKAKLIERVLRKEFNEDSPLPKKFSDLESLSHGFHAIATYNQDGKNVTVVEYTTRQALAIARNLTSCELEISEILDKQKDKTKRLKNKLAEQHKKNIEIIEENVFGLEHENARLKKENLDLKSKLEEFNKIKKWAEGIRRNYEILYVQSQEGDDIKEKSHVPSPKTFWVDDRGVSNSKALQGGLPGQGKRS